MQISILNEQKTLIQFALHGKQIACFIRLFAGQIMTSIVIQFVRLVFFPSPP